MTICVHQYFSEATPATAPSSYISAGPHNDTRYVRFGVEDLTIYVLSYYNNLVQFGADTDGCRFRRVRVRANAFHCGNEANRKPAWEWGGGGKNPLFRIHASNWEVSDCDLWSTWSVFHTSGIYAPVISGHSYLGWQTARWGLIQRNKIFNGGACHWFDQGKQILFEENTCIGNNPMSKRTSIHHYCDMQNEWCTFCPSNGVEIDLPVNLPARSSLRELLAYVT